MDTHLATIVDAGRDAARGNARRTGGRLRIRAGKVTVTVLDAWPGGFSVAASGASLLPGRVSLYDGARLVSHGLVIASAVERGVVSYEYKCVTDAAADQPLDFQRRPAAPPALPGPLPDH